MLKVTISKGNKKMGEIKSVSLPPIKTCAKNCTCAKKCYAAKLCRIYKNVAQSYENNLMAYMESPIDYFNQVKKAACTQKFFRWHVSGDILNELYLYDMVRIAEELPGTDFLCFTKKYDLVNEFLNHKTIPDNLHIIFSEWEGMSMENPYNLPVAHVVFKGCEPLESWEICQGNCLECALNGYGCWHMKKGDNVAFYEH